MLLLTSKLILSVICPLNQPLTLSSSFESFWIFSFQQHKHKFSRPNEFPRLSWANLRVPSTWLCFPRCSVAVSTHWHSFDGNSAFQQITTIWPKNSALPILPLNYEEFRSVWRSFRGYRNIWEWAICGIQMGTANKNANTQCEDK